MCGGFTEVAAGPLTAWAQCWFLVLVIVVLVTVGVLFCIALLEILRLSRKI